MTEKLRAHGAGIPAFHLDSHLSTDGSGLEQSLGSDFSLIKGHIADMSGNVRFKGTAWNINETMAKAGKRVFVEVDEIVEAGSINPEQVHLQGIYVDALIQTSFPSKEALINQDTSNGNNDNLAPLTIISPEVDCILKRAIKELNNDSTIKFVSLGMGIPQNLVNYPLKKRSDNQEIWFHDTNGMLGSWEIAPPNRQQNKKIENYPNHANHDFVNSNNQIITPKNGSSILNSNDSFAILRGGRIDIAFLGAMQASH